jgi:serine phosphatase RsbU (regulator of sigma subunit)
MVQTGSKILGFVAAVVTTAAMYLVFGDILRNVTLWKSAFSDAWTMTDSCLIEQISDNIEEPLSRLEHAPALRSDRLKFPLRLNSNLNYFLSKNRAARVSCSLAVTGDLGRDQNSLWLILGPVDGDLALWIDDHLAFTVVGQSAFPVVPLPMGKSSFNLKILTRPHQNGQLAMTSLFPITVTDQWTEVVRIQKVYSFARVILPFGTMMLFIGLCVLFVTSFNTGIRYPDVFWTMIGLAIGLLELGVKVRLGFSTWWTYEMQLAVYSSLAVALCYHIHRDFPVKGRLAIFLIPTLFSASLIFFEPQTRGVIVSGWKLTSWIQVVLFSAIAISGFRRIEGLGRSRRNARQLGIYTAWLVAFGLVATNALIEIKGIWLREIMLIMTTMAIAAVISLDLVLFHRGYFKEKALRTDEQLRREREEREKLRLAEALAIGQTAQELLLPMQIERTHPGVLLKYRCVPHINMAGDWMDSWEGRDDSVVILLGDVSGKGPSAAIAMASIMTLTQEFRINKLSLTEAVEAMSPRLFDLFKGAIVSTWAGVQIYADGSMRFSGGGSPGWFVLSSDEVKFFACRQSMMGLSGSPINVSAQECSPMPGARVISVSDGVCGSSRQLRQFMQHIRSCSENEKTTSELIEHLFNFATLQNIADDRSLVIIERDTAGPRSRLDVA